MSQFSTAPLLKTKMVTIRDIVCNGACRHKSDEECAHKTSLVYPHRGVFMRHVGRNDTVAEANQVLFFNAGQSYRISHPIEGGDACIDLAIDEAMLEELAPKEQVQAGPAFSFRRQRRRIDPRAQALVALLRHGLSRNIAETLEVETLALTLVLSSDLTRRWTLAEIASEVGVSPVYLTQVFQQVEATPLYRYQLRLRLARALDLLGQYEDLTALGLDLGFSSHSHFSASFKQAFGQSPGEFQRAAQLRRR
ncbi:helix-turn-helix domain-containing protein [Rhizobium hidalgonense]|uniref:AraC family transcriptional regulator n=1 Tax=Rhizobium hidalgonense TaxID=1538159 RepID=A0ABX4JQK0_9HYPH|nr:helix-turn-helix domain-containing protein [Rhizobium hidalgonense]PDT21027.1 AraC family transcriptional regulator [Rhizobium hidalgonense]PON07258.1 AraC family transcriptional regulator [Rhizobium hidalgonense]